MNIPKETTQCRGEKNQNIYVCFMIEEEIAVVLWVGETTALSRGLPGRSEGAEEASNWMQGKRF